MKPPQGKKLRLDFRRKVESEEVYIALTEKSSILNDYIVPEYETLHTQSKEYIVAAIIEVMEERGVKI